MKYTQLLPRLERIAGGADIMEPIELIHLDKLQLAGSCLFHSQTDKERHENHIK